MLHTRIPLVKLKVHFLILVASITCQVVQAQTYLLTVNNGYGSGSYNVGDTVNIWAKEFPENSVYDHWTGDTAGIDMPYEWHTTLIMPGANITVTANFTSGLPYNIILDTIQGQVIAKPVYYYFPSNYYGVIYFFHGTGGSAKGVVNSVENRQMINQAIADSFAVIITEADEATTGIDANADGKLRWLVYPLDSVNNSDYANIKIITDTFISRGFMNRNTLRFSIGMSNGGVFAGTCASLFGFQAGISYCASGAAGLYALTNVPFQFCMAKYDANPEVGADGNADALANSQILENRGICSRYYLHDHSPVYAERFKRISGITTLQSQNVLADLVNNNMLDSNNYINVLPDTIQQRYFDNPVAFPGLGALNGLQKAEVLNELKACYADHQFYSDYDALSLKFLKNPCDSNAIMPTGAENIAAQTLPSIFPNPAISLVHVDGLTASKFEVEIINALGKVVMQQKNKTDIDVSGLASGIYFFRLTNNGEDRVQKVIKQ